MRLLVPIGRVTTARTRLPNVVATVRDDLGRRQVCGRRDPFARIGSVLTWTEHRVALLAQRLGPELYDKRLLGATRCARYSLDIQAFSGFASLNGSPGSQGESLRNIGFIDLTTSALTVPAILAALLAREQTGTGQHIVASMLEAAVTLQMSRVAEFFATGQSPAPCGSGMPYSVPDQALRVRDGYLAVSARTQAEWERLCRALGQEALLDDPRYRTLAARLAHRRELMAHLAGVFHTHPAAWWSKVLTQAGVPCGRFHTYDEMSVHPQVRLNQLMAEVPHTPLGDGSCGWTPLVF